MGVTCSYSSTPGLGSFAVGVAKCHGSTILGGGRGSWVIGIYHVQKKKKNQEKKYIKKIVKITKQKSESF